MILVHCITGPFDLQYSLTMPDSVMRDPYDVRGTTHGSSASAYTDGNPLGTSTGAASSNDNSRDTSLASKLPPHMQEKVDSCKSSARYAAFGGGLG